MTGDPRPGRPYPQGATWDGQGTNFSLFTENADRVDLCLFDEDGTEQRYDIRGSLADPAAICAPGSVASSI